MSGSNYLPPTSGNYKVLIGQQRLSRGVDESRDLLFPPSALEIQSQPCLCHLPVLNNDKEYLNIEFM